VNPNGVTDGDAALNQHPVPGARAELERGKPDTQRPRPSRIAAALVAGLLAGSLSGGAAGGALGLAVRASDPTAWPDASQTNATTAVAGAANATSDVSSMVASTRDSVVTIEISARSGLGLTATGSGSGFFVSADGLILTSYHVIDGAAQITVLLTDGSSYQARLVSSNPDRDVALLRIPATGLPALTLASGDLQIGQTVIATGTALGQYPNTVTVGVVSGLDREMTASTGIRRSETLTGVIQTDAALSSGMSGGPLLDSAGRVVGINTAVYGDANGIGFAVPIADGTALLAAAPRV
jgi:putative serine protease PepD